MLPSSQIEIRCQDGFLLRGQCWQPDVSPKGIVLLHAATGVPQGLYAGFAAYLQSRGFAAISYDYRGIGLSRPASLRGFQCQMLDWALLDVEAVMAYATDQFPQLPLLAVGHSFGGHAIGLCDSSVQLRAAAFVASHAATLQVIYHRVERWRARFLLRQLGPFCAATLGYLPARALRLGEDLPAGVIRQWGHWAGQPRYFFDDPDLQASRRFARPAMPVLAIGFADDLWATPPGIDLLMSQLVNCQVERRHIEPQPQDGTIGHMGFFRRKHQHTLWPELADWLELQLV